MDTANIAARFPCERFPGLEPSSRRRRSAAHVARSGDSCMRWPAPPHRTLPGRTVPDAIARDYDPLPGPR